MVSFEWIKNIFRIDLRSLALFRIVLGALVALDSFRKFFLVDDFYSDLGVMPRLHWIEHYMRADKFSFHLLFGDSTVLHFLLGLQVLLALAFTLGYKTRFVNVLLWFFVCSLQSRNYLILSSADQLMRMGLFWCMFLPMGARFSMDGKAQGQSISNIGSAALLVQFAVMYIFTAFLKWHPVWTKDFTAVHYALHIDIFAKPLGVWLRNFFPLTQFMTASTMVLEIVGPLLALTGLKWIRFAMAVVFIGFHLSLMASMEIGLFPMACIAFWLLYFGTEFWGSRWGVALERRLDQTFSQKSYPLKPMWSVSQVFVCFCLSLVLWVNLASVRVLPLTRWVDSTTMFLYVDQAWEMFAPYPIRNDGWFIIEGKTRSGKIYDVKTGGPVTLEKPALLSATFPGSEWRKFLLNAWDSGAEKILKPYGQYLCRSGDDPLVALSFTFMKETTALPGETWPPVQRVYLYEMPCAP